MKLKKLPIGIQTFKKIINENYTYIDKTQIAYNLINDYQNVFLSRPRRFGKSLFLDTLHNIFEGNKELFKGLYIYDKWDFEDKYPVIKISWGGNLKTLESTNKKAISILKDNQKRLGVECEDMQDASICFDELIKKTYEKYNKPVVILIDEYDKPILDNLDNTTIAIQNRDFLRGLYVMLKENDAYIKFAFLTGISKFSKASIFSGLNNLTDISLNKRYGNICGYTQENIEYYFKEYLVDVDLKKVQSWYNGYNFLGQKVYNPFDLLQYLDTKEFKNYWWESGNPYFLIEILKKGDYFIPNVENLKTDESLLNSFDIKKLKLEVLLFQSGYLSIDKQFQKRDKIFYTLKVPNKEVQISLNELFLMYLTDRVDFDIQDNIYDSLYETDLQMFKNSLISLFASIPYNNYVKNNISNFEGYYASVIYTYLASLGVEMIAEDVTNRGRIDLSIKLNDKIYIIEFKMQSEDALSQIKEKNYHQKYLNNSKEIYLVGINFDEDKKNITKFEWEKVEVGCG